MNLIEYNLTDIPYDVAYRAHSGTSFSPEKRAEQVQAGYVEFMVQVETEFSQWVNDDNRAQISSALANFKSGYLKKTMAHLYAKSRCISVMITGPSNFPTRRNQKANDAEHNRATELIEWTNKTLDRLRSEFDPHRLANAPIMSDDVDAVAKLQAKLEKVTQLQETMKACNKVVKNKRLSDEDKIEQLKAIVGDTVATELLKPNFSGEVGFAGFELTNNNTTIKRLKDRIAVLERESKRSPVEDKQVNGVTVIENTDISRLQLIYPGKPDAATIANLKRHGFKWSPTQGAWQRLLNDNARYAAKEITK